MSPSRASYQEFMFSSSPMAVTSSQNCMAQGVLFGTMRLSGDKRCRKNSLSKRVSPKVAAVAWT